MSRKYIHLIVIFGVSFFLFPPLNQAQVTLTVGDGSGYRGSHNNPVSVSLSNPSDTVKRVQVDVCDVDDFLSVLDCTVTERGRDGFTCQVISLPSGCARVNYSSPGGLIEGDTGDIFTLRYNVSASAPDGQCRVLEQVNYFVFDEFNNPLTVTPDDGNFCFNSCGGSGDCEDDLYCNGTEGCSGGICTHSGDPCPGGECNTCQEDKDNCFDPEGIPCTDDGIYCNGDETCNGSGSCGHAGSPCPNATCVEGDDQCTCNLPGESCEDGNYCNGGDFCLFGVCEHTGDPCPPLGLHCDDLVGRCTCLVDAECDDENICTNDSCAADGTCRNSNNTNSCDDGIFCNGIDTCSCGDCVHQGNPCNSSQACYEDTDQCSSPDASLSVMSGSGRPGTTGNPVSVSLSNTDLIKGVSFEVCEEHDYLTISDCTPAGRAATAGFSCSSNELDDGCALVVLVYNSGTGLFIGAGSGPIATLSYDVKGADQSETGCIDTDVDEAQVVDSLDNILGTSGIPDQFCITCSNVGDCNDSNLCTTDSCNGGSCVHTSSGATSCDDGLYCTESDSCSGLECIGQGETCGSIFLCDETAQECVSCFDDGDCDGVPDGSDNCLDTPNGPYGGFCTAGSSGEPCLEHCDCTLSNGYCSLTQEDSYPPAGNNVGDACDCEGNFDCDADVDGSDAQLFKTDFGRSPFLNPCTNANPCNGDFDCDGDVDGTDARVFKDDFGRSGFKNPCPPCVVGIWCAYQ